MSADSHSVCPKCHSEDLDKVGVWQNFTDGEDTKVRENYETYWQNKQSDLGKPDLTLFLVHEYRAECWACDWSFTHTFEIPMPV